MKKFAFLVSLLVITSLSFSQLATNKHATHISNKIKKKHKSKSLNTYIIDSSYRFNWVNSSWNLASKSNYTYDNTHSEIASTTSNFSNNKFSLSDKITYNNDPIIGSDTLDYEYSWDTISKNWNQTQKYEFAYCKDLATIDNDSLEIDYTFSNNTWVNSLKYTYTYDQYGLDSVDVDYSWNGTTWNETNRYFTIGHAYTINGDDSLIVFSKWDYINKKQVLSDKQEYFYDANNTLTSIVYSVWDINSKKWIYDSKVDYTYDANDNEIQRLYSNWNTTNSTWENNYKIVNYFSVETAGIKPLSTTNLQVFPNPTSDKITITNANSLKFSILSNDGKTLKNGSINADYFQVNVDELGAQGIYFVKIYNQDQSIQTYKLIKE